MKNLLIQEISKIELEEMISSILSIKLDPIIKELKYPSKSALPDRYLTQKEAANFLRISTVTLRKYVKLDIVKGRTLSGTRLRFKQSELEKSFQTLRAINFH
jgi:hypothetical protein